jgi:hypothetical protein
MLACWSLTAIKAEYWREYKKAASHTHNTRSLNELLKRNRSKMVAPHLNIHGFEVERLDLLPPLLVPLQGLL